MKKKSKYKNDKGEIVGRLHPIPDFLPSPEELWCDPKKPYHLQREVIGINRYTTEQIIAILRQAGNLYRQCDVLRAYR